MEKTNSNFKNIVDLKNTFSCPNMINIQLKTDFLLQTINTTNRGSVVTTSPNVYTVAINNENIRIPEYFGN